LLRPRVRGPNTEDSAMIEHVSLPLFIVDAFTREPYTGNPAAVCLLEKAADDSWMQSLAAEMNLSETAFVTRRQEGFGLRWFTPLTEVDLCGHATLASAHVLWREGWLGQDEEARFHTRSGVLNARRRGAWIEMDFPAMVAAPASPPRGLLAALGLDVVEEVLYNGMDYLVVMKSPGAVRRLEPDAGKLKEIDARGFIVTARSDAPQYDFLSRFFAPRVGIAEDPVTGSAHCALGPYWARRLGKTELTGCQVSKRGGVVRVAIKDEGVVLAGQAVTLVHGQWAGEIGETGHPQPEPDSGP